MFTWIIFSTQAWPPPPSFCRDPGAPRPLPRWFFPPLFFISPFYFGRGVFLFFPIVGSASSFSAQRMWLRWGRPPPPPQLAVPYSSTHSDLDPPCPPPSIHLLHRRRRRRFIRRAPPQRSSALSCFPMFDDFSLCPHDSDGSGAVGLRSSWFPSSGCITGFSHHHNGIQSPGCLPFCFICFARLDMLLIHISVSLEIAVSNQFSSCVHIYKFYLPMIYVRSQRSPSCVQNPIYSEYLLIMLTG